MLTAIKMRGREDSDAAVYDLQVMEGKCVKKCKSLMAGHYQAV